VLPLRKREAEWQIAAIVGKPDFSALAFEVNGSKFSGWRLHQCTAAFLLIAGAVSFFVIVPVNALCGSEVDTVIVVARIESARVRIGSRLPCRRW
jgi:hypothetical protein